MSAPVTGTADVELSASTVCGELTGCGWVVPGLDMADDMAALTTEMRPVDALEGAGLGWLLPQVRPLQEVLDRMAGNAPVVQSFSDTWQRAARSVREIEAQLSRLSESTAQEWQGGAAQRYREWATEVSVCLRAAATGFDAIATASSLMGRTVAGARMRANELVTDLVTLLISVTRQAMAAAGGVTPAVLAQATGMIRTYSQPVADIDAKLRQTVSGLQVLLAGETTGESRPDDRPGAKVQLALLETGPPRTSERSVAGVGLRLLTGAAARMLLGGGLPGTLLTIVWLLDELGGDVEVRFVPPRDRTVEVPVPDPLLHPPGLPPDTRTDTPTEVHPPAPTVQPQPTPPDTRTNTPIEIPPTTEPQPPTTKPEPPVEIPQPGPLVHPPGQPPDTRTDTPTEVHPPPPTVQPQPTPPDTRTNTPIEIPPTTEPQPPTTKPEPPAETPPATKPQPDASPEAMPGTTDPPDRYPPPTSDPQPPSTDTDTQKSEKQGPDPMKSAKDAFDYEDQLTKEKQEKLDREFSLEHERGQRFREGVQQLYGPPQPGQEAHHTFPVNLHGLFERIGIDTTNPVWGTWVDGKAHREFSKDYENDWRAFFGRYPDLTPELREEVFDHARTLAERYRYGPLPFGKTP